jgi:amino acid permease
MGVKTLQMLFNVVYALEELAIMYPTSGGFYTYATRFIDPVRNNVRQNSNPLSS